MKIAGQVFTANSATFSIGEHSFLIAYGTIVGYTDPRGRMYKRPYISKTTETILAEHNYGKKEERASILTNEHFDNMLDRIFMDANQRLAIVSRS